MDHSTGLIHHPYRPPDGFESMVEPVHKASTVLFPNVQAMRERQWNDRSGYTYGTHGTPSTFTLEARIATLEGAQHALLVPSGLAAITLVDMALLRSGDEVLVPDNAYEPNSTFAKVELAAWGIRSSHYNPMDPEDLRRRITPATRLVWMEAAGSVTLEFPDVPALCEVVRSCQQGRERPVITALDHTWGSGVAYGPFDWGVDVAVHALTKYPSGAADLLMGSVSTRDSALFETLQMAQGRLGLCVAANDVEAVLRSLPTVHMRYHQADASTRALAVWMQQQPQVQQVFHPALPESPGHDAWKRNATAAACLFGVLFKPQFTSEQIDTFCESLKFFGLGYSWAGPQSLALPYNVHRLRDLGWPHPGTYVRFAIGLEHVEDLKSDLKQGLQRLA